MTSPTLHVYRITEIEQHHYIAETAEEALALLEADIGEPPEMERDEIDVVQLDPSTPITFDVDEGQEKRTQTAAEWIAEECALHSPTFKGCLCSTLY